MRENTKRNIWNRCCGEPRHSTLGSGDHDHAWWVMHFSAILEVWARCGGTSPMHFSQPFFQIWLCFDWDWTKTKNVWIIDENIHKKCTVRKWNRFDWFVFWCCQSSYAYQLENLASLFFKLIDWKNIKPVPFWRKYVSKINSKH